MMRRGYGQFGQSETPNGTPNAPQQGGVSGLFVLGLAVVVVMGSVAMVMISEERRAAR